MIATNLELLVVPILHSVPDISVCSVASAGKATNLSIFRVIYNGCDLTVVVRPHDDKRDPYN